MIHLGFSVSGLDWTDTPKALCRMFQHALRHQWDQYRRSENVTARAHLGCARAKIPP
jgi:hypothetical protein